MKGRGSSEIEMVQMFNIDCGKPLLKCYSSVEIIFGEVRCRCECVNHAWT